MFDKFSINKKYSEIKINSIFDLELWIVPDPIEFYKNILKIIESNLIFSITKKAVTEKRHNI